MRAPEYLYKNTGSYETVTTTSYPSGAVSSNVTDSRSRTFVNNSRGQHLTSAATYISDPNFRIKIQKRLDAGHGYTMSRHHIVKQPIQSSRSEYWAGVPKQSNRVRSVRLDNLLGFSFPEAIPFNADYDNIALARLKNKLNNFTGQTNILVPIGEINETRRLLHEVLSTSGKLLKSLLVLVDKYNPREAFKRAAEAWLSFSFGVSPLLGDIHATANAVDKFIKRKNNGIVRFVGFSEQKSNSTSISTTTAASTLSWEQRVSYSDTLRYMYVAGVKLDLLNDTNYGIAKQLGLDFGAMLPAIWELIPYSWLVDYFTTAGAFFSDTFTNAAGTTTYVSKTVTYKREIRCLPTLVKAAGVNYIDYNSSESEIFAESFLMQRTIPSSLPHLAFRLRTADEIGFSALTKVTNLASLLASRKL